VTQGTEGFQNTVTIKLHVPGEVMDRRSIQKRIEYYEQLLQAAKDEIERRAIRRLLEQERAKLENDSSKEQSD
jgi:hypothetical protein